MEGRSRVTPLREADDSPQLPPPSNVEAEQALIGAILVNPAVYGRVADQLLPEHFSTAVHGRIFAAIGRQIEAGAPADAVLIRHLFDQDAALTALGGGAYLARLLEAAVSIANAPFYAEAIIDCYRRLMLMAAAEDLRDRAIAYDADDPVEKQIEDAGTRLFDLSDVGGSGGRQRVVSGGEAATAALEAAQRAYRAEGKLAGISSGLAALDRLIGGFAPGDLYIIGGRPGSGKTALSGSITWAALQSGYPVHFFSGEMTAPQLMARLMAALSGVSAGRQRRGDLMPADWEALDAARRTIAGWSLTIDDGPMTLPRIRQQLRQAKRRQKVALAIIDYLQLVTSDTESETRFVDIGRVSNGLKRTAKDLDIPIIACAQLSRRVEERDDKRPIISDLRGAGEIEQDSDVVVFVYRHEVYLAKAEPQQKPGEPDLKFGERHALWSNALEDSRGFADLIVAKNRHDREGVAHVRFDAERSFFYDAQEQQGLF